MKRILIVDDDEALRLLMCQVLVRAGYEVQAAESGAVALKLFRQQPADLVITDIIMPEMEGLETIIEFLKQRPKLKILAISGGGRFGADDYLPIAGALGAALTLAKPFSLEELENAVRSLLG